MSGNRIRQLLGQVLVEPRQKGEVKSKNTLPLLTIFDSPIIPFDITLVTECIFQLFILGH